MHQAPSVIYPLGSAQYLRRCVGVAWALVLVIDVLWLVQAEQRDWQLWFGLALTALAGACAYGCRPTDGHGVLQWDGRGWTRRDESREVVGEVSVHLDLQCALLVFWAPATGAGAWHLLRSSAQPWAWLALRRAVLASERVAESQVRGAQADLAARP